MAAARSTGEAVWAKAPAARVRTAKTGAIMSGEGRGEEGKGKKKEGVLVGEEGGEGGEADVGVPDVSPPSLAPSFAETCT